MDVINSVAKDNITVIAAHDLRTPPGSKEATIERFREIDRRIDQTLASKRVENAPLMRIAVPASQRQSISGAGVQSQFARPGLAIVANFQEARRHLQAGCGQPREVARVRGGLGSTPI